jgi:hypothetical protein
MCALSMSFAAMLNARVMRQLQKALEPDPEVDLMTVFPINYSSRLTSGKLDKSELHIPLRSGRVLIYQHIIENDKTVPSEDSDRIESI